LSVNIPWSAPDNYVAVRQFDADCFVGSVQAAKQEDGWDSERHRDDGLVKVLLVFVLMQRHFCARHIMIDQTGIGHEVTESGLHRCAVASRRNASGIGGQARPLTGSMGS
jgi:hypothetical protein